MKALLENALIAAIKEREKLILKGTAYSALPLGDTDVEASDVGLCCICLEQTCTIKVQQCGHQISNISQLVVAKFDTIFFFLDGKSRSIPTLIWSWNSVHHNQEAQEVYQPKLR